MSATTYLSNASSPSGIFSDESNIFHTQTICNLCEAICKIKQH